MRHKERGACSSSAGAGLWGCHSAVMLALGLLVAVSLAGFAPADNAWAGEAGEAPVGAVLTEMAGAVPQPAESDVADPDASLADGATSDGVLADEAGASGLDGSDSEDAFVSDSAEDASGSEAGQGTGSASPDEGGDPAVPGAATDGSAVSDGDETLADSVSPEVSATLDASDGEGSASLLGDEESAPVSSTGVGFVYVDEMAPTLGSTQSVAVVLDDDQLVLTGARLAYADGTGTTREIDASALAGNAALFQFSLDALGTYQLTGLKYDAISAEGTTISGAVLDFAGIADSAWSFTVSDGTSVASIEDGAEELGAASMYGIASDGSLCEVGSLAEAASLSGLDATFRTIGRDASSGEFVIALDPGHGGYDSGAIGYGLQEKDLTWAITLYCKEALEQYPGVRVVLTRSEDECPSIWDRVQRAYDAGANVLVSIHINSDPSGSASGAEIWFPNGSSWKYAQTHVPGEQLAQNVLDKLVALGLNDRGIRVRTMLISEIEGPSDINPDGSAADYYGILRYARRLGFTGVIVEHAYISSWSDAQLMGSDAMLRQMGYADAEGIAQTYGIGTDLASPFGDTLPGSWYMAQGWIPYVVENGLMTGAKDDDGVARNFYPDDYLTRGQVATILYRAANPNSTDTTDPAAYAQYSGFPDTGEYLYYNAAISWCAEQGIVTGYNGNDGNAGKFLADRPITREELATMVWRFAEKWAGVDVSNPDPTNFNKFTDKEEMWAYGIDAIRWCASEGIITGDDLTKRMLPNESATRAQAAKVITVLHRDVLGA
ncbi:MAG: N-acetylmuramoyl-L-alanine amidase [Coriobacteriia bacterium]|nr:N-acetylmuramoyl-L-alanine amidase [Coriobacteriia bacterium]